MNLLVLSLAFVAVASVQARPTDRFGNDIVPENTGEDLPSNSRPIRIAGETWPKLELTSHNVQRSLSGEAEQRMITDFWKNYGRAMDIVNNKNVDAVAIQEVKADDVELVPSPQDDTDKEEVESSVVAAQEENVENSDDLTQTDTENMESQSPSDVGFRSASQAKPESIRVPLVKTPSPPPPNYALPRNEFINQVQYPYPPRPQQPFYQQNNYNNRPGVYPTPVGPQSTPRLGYSQNAPENPVFVPNNLYIPQQQLYPPPNNFRGAPLIYQPNNNRMVPVRVPTQPQIFSHSFEPMPVPMGIPGQEANVALPPQPWYDSYTVGNPIKMLPPSQSYVV